MSKVITKIIKDGNSMAVRIPKSVLDISGIHGSVELRAKKGSILVSKANHPRSDWESKLKSDVQLTRDKELAEWDSTISDGLDNV